MEDSMHDYMNGHTCPSCGKSGIICTIEDGFCENEGTCDNCIKEKFYQQESDGHDDNSWACKHGFFEGEDCPLCEHKDGQHDVEYTGEDWLGPEYPCPMCDGYTEKEANDILQGQL